MFKISIVFLEFFAKMEVSLPETLQEGNSLGLMPWIT